MALDLSQCATRKGLGRWACERNLTRSYNKQLKYDYKLGRTEIVQTNRTDRNGNKFNAFSIAYANGMDPRKSMWEGISSSVGSVASAATAIMAPNQFGSVLGGGMHNTNASGNHDGRTVAYPRNTEPTPENYTVPDQSPNNNALLAIGGLGLLYFLSQSKGRR